MRGVGLLLSGLLVLVVASANAVLAAEDPPVDDSGLYTQPWFNQTSFLDLREDIAEAKAQGKRLAILFEQRGCPYCREMHRVNFAKKAIVDYVKANFVVLQLNLWGDREVTDFAGRVLPEKKLARQLRVSFTPTIVFPEENGEEAFRIPGYFKPFHFLSVFEYVKKGAYRSEPNFQRWLQEKGDRLRAEGKEVKLW